MNASKVISAGGVGAGALVADNSGDCSGLPDLEEEPVGACWAGSMGLLAAETDSESRPRIARRLLCICTFHSATRDAGLSGSICPESDGVFNGLIAVLDAGHALSAGEAAGEEGRDLYGSRTVP